MTPYRFHPDALQEADEAAAFYKEWPDPRRWDLKRLAMSGAEDRLLAEQGLAEWADALDREDYS